MPAEGDCIFACPYNRHAHAFYDVSHDYQPYGEARAEAPERSAPGLWGVAEAALALGHNTAGPLLGHRSGEWFTCDQPLCLRGQAVLAAEEKE